MKDDKNDTFVSFVHWNSGKHDFVPKSCCVLDSQDVIVGCAFGEILQYSSGYNKQHPELVAILRDNHASSPQTAEPELVFNAGFGFWSTNSKTTRYWVRNGTTFEVYKRWDQPLPAVDIVSACDSAIVTASTITGQAMVIKLDGECCILVEDSSLKLVSICEENEGVLWVCLVSECGGIAVWKLMPHQGWELKSKTCFKDSPILDVTFMKPGVVTLCTPQGLLLYCNEELSHFGMIHQRCHSIVMLRDTLVCETDESFIVVNVTQYSDETKSNKDESHLVFQKPSEIAGLHATSIVQALKEGKLHVVMAASTAIVLCSYSAQSCDFVVSSVLPTSIFVPPNASDLVRQGSTSLASMEIASLQRCDEIISCAEVEFHGGQSGRYEKVVVRGNYHGQLLISLHACCHGDKATQGMVVENDDKASRGMVVENDDKASREMVVENDDKASRDMVVENNDKATPGMAVENDDKATQGMVVENDDKATQGMVVENDDKATQGMVVENDDKSSREMVVENDDEAIQGTAMFGNKNKVGIPNDIPNSECNKVQAHDSTERVIGVVVYEAQIESEHPTILVVSITEQTICFLLVSLSLGKMNDGEKRFSTKCMWREKICRTKPLSCIFTDTAKPGALVLQTIDGLQDHLQSIVVRKWGLTVTYPKSIVSPTGMRQPLDTLVEVPKKTNHDSDQKTIPQHIRSMPSKVIHMTSKLKLRSNRSDEYSSQVKQDTPMNDITNITVVGDQSNVLLAKTLQWNLDRQVDAECVAKLGVSLPVYRFTHCWGTSVNLCTAPRWAASPSQTASYLLSVSSLLCARITGNPNHQDAAFCSKLLSLHTIRFVDQMREMKRFQRPDVEILAEGWTCSVVPIRVAAGILLESAIADTPRQILEQVAQRLFRQVTQELGVESSRVDATSSGERFGSKLTQSGTTQSTTLAVLRNTSDEVKSSGEGLQVSEPTHRNQDKAQINGIDQVQYKTHGNVQHTNRLQGQGELVKSQQQNSGWKSHQSEDSKMAMKSASNLMEPQQQKNNKSYYKVQDRKTVTSTNFLAPLLCRLSLEPDIPTKQYINKWCCEYLLQGILHPISNPLQVICLELLASGLETWKPYIDTHLPRLIRHLFKLELASSGTQSVRLQIERTMEAIGSMYPVAFITITGTEVCAPESRNEYRIRVLMCALGVIKSRKRIFAPSVATMVEIVIHCLDPSDPVTRKELLGVCSKFLHDLVKFYPSLSFYQTGQQFAVGTTNGKIVLYDLRTATKLRVLETKTAGEVVALSFSDNGKSLLSISLSDVAEVDYWRCSNSSMLSGMLGLRGGPYKSIPIPGADTSNGIVIDMESETESAVVKTMSGQVYRIPKV